MLFLGRVGALTGPAKGLRNGDEVRQHANEDVCHIRFGQDSFVSGRQLGNGRFAFDGKTDDQSSTIGRIGYTDDEPGVLQSVKQRRDRAGRDRQLPPKGPWAAARSASHRKHCGQLSAGKGDASSLRVPELAETCVENVEAFPKQAHMCRASTDCHRPRLSVKEVE